MSISITGGINGISVESDPTALKLTGGTLSGELYLPTARNLLNADLNIVAYNDTGAGTTYTHSFKPFDGTFQLASNGGGLRFPNGTVQNTAGLPLTGGTATGKVNFTSVGGTAGLNIGIGGTNTSATTAGDLWISTGGASLNYRDGTGAWRILPALSNANVFTTNQAIAGTTTGALLRLSQAGTGNVFVVEDTANPDTDVFVVNADGNIGVGVSTTFTPTAKFEVVGSIKGTTITNGTGPAYAVNSVATYVAGTLTHQIAVSIGGSTYRIPAIFVSTP